MRFIKLIKRPLFLVLFVIVLGLVLAVYFYFFRKTGPVYDFVLVKRGELVQEVSVTGKVKPAEEVELAFEKSGKVSGVYAKVGDAVEAGKPLVILNSNDLEADLAQAQAAFESSRAQYKQYEAALAVQEAKLAELKIGTRPEEIQIQESKVESARISLNEAKKNLADKIQDAYTKSDDAVRNKVDQFFSNPRGASPSINFTIGDSQLKVSIENGRSAAEKILTDWQSSLQNLTATGDLNSYAVSADNNLDAIKSFLDKVSLAVNSLTLNSTLSQTTIDAWKLDVSTARTNMNTGLTNLSTAVEEFKAAQTALTVAENQLILEKAGNTVEQIAAQEAVVEQARANLESQASQIKQAEAKVQSGRVQIAKNTLLSPIDGIVTRQDAKIGEIAAANGVVVSVISLADFQVEANIPEVDIAKVQVGEQADITLDAYGENVIFKSRVIKVDPAETVVESVSTYKTTLQFEQKDERIKSGMTANITIFSDKREGALYVPQRVVAARNGDKFVQVSTPNGIEERKVVTGLRDASGNIEILSGLSEGESLVNFLKK